MVGTSASSTPPTVEVRVLISTGERKTARVDPEWELVTAPRPELPAATRARLAARLSSKQATRTPVQRIVAAYQAGQATLDIDLSSAAPRSLCCYRPQKRLLAWGASGRLYLAGYQAPSGIGSGSQGAHHSHHPLPLSS